MPIRKRRSTRLTALLIAALALALPASATAQTFVVDTLADNEGGLCEAAAPADCTLRGAVTLANQTAEADTIEFEVAGTIELQTSLPTIFNPVQIDATTVSGYAGAPLVALEAGTQAASEGEGLALIGGADGSSVAGLAIGGFQRGVLLGAPGGGMSICATYLGVGLDGQTATPNVNGVDTGVGSPGNLIGAGCGSLGGNLISANSSYGIVDFGAGTQISENMIGLDLTGAPLGNGPQGGAGAGIFVTALAEGTFIGGVPSPGPGESAPNTIAANNGYGVLVESSASHASIRRNSSYGDTLGAIGFGEGGGAGPLEVNNFVAGPSGTTVTVFLAGVTPNHTYEVDAYASSQCDANQYGPGEVFLGTGSASVDAGGNGVAEVRGIALTGIDAESFTAIATDTTTGTTTQFSLCGRTTPITSIDSEPPPLTTSTAATFTFSATDFGHVAGFSCSLDGGGFASCTTPEELTGLADGSHSFVVRAFDGEGSSDSPGAFYSWTVDTTPPNPSIDSGPGGETTSRDASFAFSAIDATSGVETLECSLDGAGFEACTSPKQVEGLGEGQHDFRVRATDKAGNRSDPATYAWKVGSPHPPPEEKKPTPKPENGESVAVAPASGKVFVTRPGGERTELKEGETIPVGSIVDATNGKVMLTSVNKAGETQTALFYGGIFVVQQHDGSNLVILELRGKVGPCKASKGRRGQPRIARGGRKGRRLWGSGHGKFRTEGNYGSASVRGTIWLTEDRCDGTFFKVRRGVVSVRDFTLGKTISLPKGQTYLAHP
jgi:CSLREA domain-containing protein